MAKAKIICGDCTKVLKKLPNNYFSSCVTDPPYELGFMGKSWDASGIAYNVDMWREVLRVLKPGAHLLSFGGSRTYHRMACAIEDAGFEIRDQIQWIYGCLSEDTEILVDGRWEPYHKAIEGSLALCYDIDEDTFAWMPVQEVFVYEYSDTAYRIVSDITDQIVSRNHRCVVEQDGTRVFGIAEEIARERQACVPILENVQGLLKAVSLPHQGTSAAKPNVFDRVQGETDWFSKSRTRSQNAVIYNVSDVREAIHSTARNTQCGLLQSSVRGESKGVSETVFRQYEGAQENRQALRREESCMEGRGNVLQDSRKLCGREVCTMPSGISADGSERRICDGTQVACGAADRKVAQAVRSGASHRPRPEEQPTRESSVVFEQCPSQKVRGQGFTATTLARIEPINYVGKVWCVKVPTGAFVARRNGRAFVTGNSGFPKSLDISKAIDKAAGAERTEGARLWTGGRRTGCIANSPETNLGTQTLVKYDMPATDAAKHWQGYGTALKPAHEPIVMARKPLSESTIAANVLKHGTGGINIDGCRIGNEWITSLPSDRSKNNKYAQDTWTKSHVIGERRTYKGRWPANVCFDEEAAELLGAPSRFFYCAKAPKSERYEGNNHPTVKPLTLMRWLVKLVTPPYGVVLDPFLGSGTTALAAVSEGFSVLGIEKEPAYCAISRKRLAL